MPDRPERRLSRTGVRMPLVLVALLLIAVPTGIASGKSRKSNSRPKVSGFAFSPTTFNPGAMKDTKRAKRSTTITFTLSERARVRMAVARRGAGRRSGRRCVAPKRSLRNRKACTLYRRVGTVTRWRLKAGKIEMSFSGRIHGRALPNGSYRATIVAIDPQRQPQRAQDRQVRDRRSRAGPGAGPDPRPSRPPVRAGLSAGTSAPARRRSPARLPPSRRSRPRRRAP